MDELTKITEEELARMKRGVRGKLLLTGSLAFGSGLYLGVIPSIYEAISPVAAYLPASLGVISGMGALIFGRKVYQSITSYSQQYPPWDNRAPSPEGGNGRGKIAYVNFRKRR